MGVKRDSNYETMKKQMGEEFGKYDQDKMLRKFPLSLDEDYIYIKFLGRDYRIDRKFGTVEWSEDGFHTVTEGDYNEAMTIYDVLCYSKEDCCLAYEWVNVGSLSSIQSGTLEKRGNFFQDAGNDFTGRADALCHACEKLGGKKLEKGDAAYELPLFPFLPLILRFWDADEDFPASLQILVDKNILDYMHYETLMFAISHLLDRLTTEM